MMTKCSTDEAGIDQVRIPQDEGFRDFAESLIRYIDEVFFWCNPGEIVPYYVSDAFERIWERPCSTVYASPSSWVEAIHPADRNRVWNLLQEISHGRPVQLEYRIVRPRGDCRWIWLRSFPTWNEGGSAKRIIGIAQDVTDRKRAEESRAFLASIVESSDDSIIGTNLDAEIVSWNGAAERLFGYAPEEVLGQHISLLFHPNDAPDQKALVATFRRQERIERFEAVRVGKGGRAIDVAVILSPVWGESSELQGVSAIYRDITDRKRAEREREAMEIQLRHAQKLESIGQLAAGIAHEINTPVQYIGDNVRFVKEAFADLQDVIIWNRNSSRANHAAEMPGEPKRAVDIEYLVEEIPKALDQTLDGVTRVATLVAAMKEFSHPGTKEMTSIDLNNAISSTTTVARNEWKYVADLETDFDATLPLVTCLPGDVNQVILNLVVNAAHAIADKVKDGGRGSILIQTRNRDPWAEIRIRDTGGGIPEGIRDRIFEPFFTTKQVGRGTGQGLAIARAVVVEKHGGTIRFESFEGEGTTFIIRLPFDGLRMNS